jgi:hypothetical protein
LFTFGHVRQLDAVAAGLLTRLAVATPILAGADQVTFLDIDDTLRATYGYAKQGSGRGYTGVKGLNALLATLSTPLSAPVIAATRLRKGSTNSVRGAAKLLADALATAHRAGAAGLLIVRADSAYYGHDIIATAQRVGARFSITARQTATVTRAITGIDAQAWTPIRYPNAIWDDQEQRWVSDAEVAEISFTAFTGRRKAEHITARLIVRRVRRLNPATTARGGQDELFATYRYHAVFTDSPEPMLLAEATHRDHAIVEQVIADLKSSALAHLPSGVFTANAAWLVCAAISHNLTRAAGALASAFHARSPDRNHPRPADPHSRPDRPLRRPPRAAPPAGLALRTRARRTVPPRPARPAPRSSLTTGPQGATTGDHPWKRRADRPTDHAQSRKHAH